MLKILVLCTGNSCRSIIAESLFNTLGKGQVEAFSAGSQPTGFVHPLALATLAQHGMPAVAAKSQSWHDFSQQAFDYIITVCDHAAGETCPVFPGHAQRLHWPTPDPAAARGSEAAIDAAFQTAFRFLKDRVQQLLATIPDQQGGTDHGN